MATSIYAPGIIHEDRFDNSGPIAGADSSTAAFLGKTTWGPLNTPTLVTSLSQFLRQFGPYRSDSDMAFAVKGFFDNGGQRAYIVRQAHYSDVAAGTTSAAAATKAVNDGDADKIFDIDAKYVGAYGNNIDFTLVANPKVNTTLAAGVLAAATTCRVTSPNGIYAGQILKISDGVNTEYVKVVSIVTAVVSGSAQHTVTFTGALANAYDSGDDVDSLEFDLNIYYEDSVLPVESFKQLSLESSTANFIETVVNNVDTGSIYVAVDLDETNTLLAAGYSTVPTDTYYPAAQALTALTGGVAVGTIAAADIVGSSAASVGIHALDDQDDVRLIAVIPDSDGAAYSGAVLHELASFCEARTFCHFVGEASHSNGPSAAITQRNADGVDSRYGYFTFNRIKVADPLNVGSTRFVSPLGHILGRTAYVDSQPGQGPWDAAAGTRPYGNLVGALDVERSVSEANRVLLNNASINVIRNVRGEGVVVWGVRTLSSTDDRFIYVNTARSFGYIKQSVSEGLQWAVFRNNDTELAQQIKASVGDFLNSIWQDGGLKGDTPEEAYEILAGEADGVQSPTDTLEGRAIVQVAVALQRPAEFVIFRWSELVGN